MVKFRACAMTLVDGGDVFITVCMMYMCMYLCAVFTETYDWSELIWASGSVVQEFSRLKCGDNVSRLFVRI